MKLEKAFSGTLQTVRAAFFYHLHKEQGTQ